MAELKRKYVIPLRRACQRVAYYKKSGKAIREIRAFCQKHMKVKEVKIGKELNEKIWENNRTPPHKVEVEIVKKDDNFAIVNLIGKSLEIKTKADKEKEKEKKKAKKETKKEEKSVEKEKKEETKKAIEHVPKKETKTPQTKTKPQTKKVEEKMRHQNIVAEGKR